MKAGAAGAARAQSPGPQSRFRARKASGPRAAPKKRVVAVWCSQAEGRVPPEAEQRAREALRLIYSRRTERGRKAGTQGACFVTRDEFAIRRVQAKFVRCPTCGRRLRPRAFFDYTFDGFALPRHKVKPSFR